MPYKDPEKQKAYRREWMRMNRAGESGTPRATLNPAPVRIKTATDILDLLEVTINEVRDADSDVLTKARCVGYLAGIALKAVETADLEKRLIAVEKLLKGRHKTA